MGELTSRQTTALRRILFKYRLIFGVTSTVGATGLAAAAMRLAAPSESMPANGPPTFGALAALLAYALWRMLWWNLLHRFPGLVQIFDRVDG